MNADEISQLLEEQLKTISHEIRITLLKSLHHSSYPLSFSHLKKKISQHHSANVNLSFHLNALKNNNLIQSSENGYLLTPLGIKIVKSLETIENILNEENEAVMIRTSKYSKEPFKIEKIEEYLIKEGNLEKNLAKKIANETINRLHKTNIEYLTAPLMRELINAILIENGLEKIRHKLTRLGTPPNEVFKLFHDSNITPEKYLKKLGSDVSEQFLLLNLLPNNLADLYLSNDVLLLHLNTWNLRPISCLLNTNNLMNFIKKKEHFPPFNSNDHHSITRCILKFFDFLENIFQFFSDDIILGDFDQFFLENFKNLSFNPVILSVLQSRINHLLNKTRDSFFPNLGLDFSQSFQEQDENKENLTFFKEITKNLNQDENFYCGFPIKPLLLIRLSKLLINDKISFFQKTGLIDGGKNNIIFYINEHSNLLNSALIKISKETRNKLVGNQLIMDKILINLQSVASLSKGNDDFFLEKINDRLNSVFELFFFKESFITRKLGKNKSWNYFISKFFNDSAKESLESAVRSISFFNFREAIITHCGLDFEISQSSIHFGLRILKEMNSLIQERKEDENVNYTLTQPHALNRGLKSHHGDDEEMKNCQMKFNSELIKKKTSLSLQKRIKLHEKISQFVNGGSLFNMFLPLIDIQEVQELMQLLFNSTIPFFSINSPLI
ncbi:MAG: anaerobic ribonucleoside-triphosphate reductase [Promethearchaeota archaeon]